MRRDEPATSPNSALKNHYLRWLENELTSESDRPDRSYFELCWVMFNREFEWSPEFEWSLPMDDNRLADGMEMRWEYAQLHSISRGEMEELGPCSFLEVLLGLARRLSFQAGHSSSRWGWQLLVNLQLDRMWDHLSRVKTSKVLDILNTVITRTYEPNGVGGFFPLAYSDRDQRQVELWYQLNAYVEELHPEH